MSSSKPQYNLPPIQDILIATKESDQKADNVLKFISENRQKVETCDGFHELVKEALSSDELFVKLYVIFIYMIRDSVFFDDICKRFNDFAKVKFREKLDDIKKYILGLQCPSTSQSQHQQEKEYWRYHLGVYIHQIQSYCMCL